MKKTLKILLIILLIQLDITTTSSKIVQSNDEEPPIITILTPVNNTIYNATIWYCGLDTFFLDYTVNEEVLWTGYSLDQNMNVTITGNTSVDTTVGVHHVVIFANDSVGNMGRSPTVYFTIKSFPPSTTNTTTEPPSKTSSVVFNSWCTIIPIVMWIVIKRRRKKQFSALMRL